MGLGAEADLRPMLAATAPDGQATTLFASLTLTLDPNPDPNPDPIPDQETTLFASLAEAYASPRNPPKRGAFVFASDNSPAPLPNHISFLWSEVDDAMGSLLSPLIPLAKASPIPSPSPNLNPTSTIILTLNPNPGPNSAPRTNSTQPQPQPGTRPSACSCSTLTCTSPIGTRSRRPLRSCLRCADSFSLLPPVRECADGRRIIVS